MNGISHISRFFTIRVQAAVLIALCLASVALLSFDLLTKRLAPEKERELRESMTKACESMAGEAGALEELSGRSTGELAAIGNKVLAEYPATEGGFYLGGEEDTFVGYAFPSRPRPPGERRRNDPPPLETPYIRLQAKDSLTAPAGQVRTSVHDVESSEVMIVTAPVGSERPAKAAAWVMYRLIDPRSLTNQVRRYQTSTGMAILGLALAALLLVNLGRSLKNQRLSEMRLREELRRSEHLAALGKLLAGVAHEVRNPLAAIRSTVQLWQRLPDSRNGNSMDSVVQAVDRLNDTVTQLLYFSRADHVERHPVDVNALICGALDLLSAQAASQGVTIERDFDARLQPIAGSANALNQVIVNLIQNALQSMPGGGRLRISTKWNDRSRELRLQVSDSGSGVPIEQREHLFEPFFTTRPEGTGLGLALCREIVQQHGGRIEYVEGASLGATFEVTLPE